MKNPRRRVGVIAEDETDCDTIRTLIQRILPEPERLGVKPRPSHGCHHIIRKAPAWMRELAAAGCSAVIVVHDCDRDPTTNALNDPGAIARRLEALERPGGLETLFCIPVQEIEAWFFSDESVIKTVGRGMGKAVASPHSVVNPKEELKRLSFTVGGKPRYSTNDNPTLAKTLDLGLCAERCPAFADLRQFVLKIAA